MAALADLVVDLQMNTASLKKGMDDATSMFSDFQKKIEQFGEAAVAIEAVELAMEGVKKAAEFMKQGLEDAAALGNKPAQELQESFEHVGLATRQLGADLMSNLAPAFNALIEHFVGGVNWGKLFANVASFLADAFRLLLTPIVALLGAIKGLADGGTWDSLKKGMGDALDLLAKKGSSFAGSLKTAAEQAAIIAGIQLQTSQINISREATLMRAQADNLTGNRRNDRFAGVLISGDQDQLADVMAKLKESMSGLSDEAAKSAAMTMLANSAINTWQKDMKEAAELTAQAAVAEAHHDAIGAANLRAQAEQATASADAIKRVSDAWRAAKEKLLTDAAEINNIKFNLGEIVAKNALSANIRTQQFNNSYDPTAGFKNFADALDKQTKALDNQAASLAAAEMINKEFGATASGTVIALKEQAAQDGRQAEAAKAAADAFFAVKDRLRDQLMNALKDLGDSFLSNIGTLGKTIGDVIKGAQQGGIWGALAAAIMDLLSQIKGWTDIQNIANGQMKELLGTMASGLGAIINGLKPLMGALGILSNVVGTLLNPIFELIGQVLQGIAPIFVILGEVLKPLAGTFQQISSLLGGVLKPVLEGITYLFIGIGEVMLTLQLAVDYVILAFNEFVDWFDRNITHSGNNGQGVASAIDSVNATLDAMKLLASQTPDQWAAMGSSAAFAAGQIGAQADAANASAAALNKLTTQLTNVPVGFKTALRTYQSISASASSQGWGPAGSGFTIQHLEVKANSMTQLYDELSKVHARKKFNGGGG